MEWIELKKENFLSAEKMNAIYNDCCWIFETLQSQGVSTSFLVDSSVTYSENIRKIVEKLNRVNVNIENIVTSADFVPPDYATVLSGWKYNTKNKKRIVDNWIDCLNYYHDVLTGKIKGLKYLTDNEGNRIVDLKGNYVLVYKG